MPRSNALPGWPWTAVDGDPADTPLALDSLLEAQTRIWNHLLDANRSLWDLFSPWMQAFPWLAPFTATQPREEPGAEPALTADGLPDAFELQARSWNHFLDAQRSFWSAVNWPLPAAAWAGGTNEDAGPDDTPEAQDDEASDDEAEARPRRSRRGAR